MQAAPIEQALSVIARQTQHMSRLIDDLLDVNRMGQDKLEIRKEPCDLLNPITMAVETMASAIEEHRQAIDLDLPEEPIPVCGDIHRLRQVFVNLLHNAVKYSPEGSRILLAADLAGDIVSVRVTDYGDGLPQHLLDDIFKPFFQSPSARHHTEGGIGAGLPLVQFIVEAHGGIVTANSEGLNQGSEFLVQLPLIKDSELASDEDDDEKNWERVVVIEDQPDSRDMLSALLELEGLKVYSTGSGHDGVSLIESEKPELAIIDIGLPGLDGYDVARRVRRIPGMKPYLIALTGHGQSADVFAAKEAGFDEHLTKPLDLDYLSRLLAAHRKPTV